MELQNNKSLSILNKKSNPKKPDPYVVIKKSLDRKIVQASSVSKFLFKAKGTWPFDLLPDELIIEEKRLIIKTRIFPFYTTVNSLPLSRLTVFELTNSIFFSGIKIKGSYGDGIDLTFSWLKHSVAEKVKTLVDGLRLKESESIELTSTDKNSMVSTLQMIGSF